MLYPSSLVSHKNSFFAQRRQPCLSPRAVTEQLSELGAQHPSPCAAIPADKTLQEGLEGQERLLARG